MCHNHVIQEQFTDGFVFIELGPQATDPSIKLRAIYNLLTDEQCDINVVEQKIDQLTSDYYRNLLVIIDDVWHVEDAEPLVTAFSNCKTILATRMNDIEQYIPCKQSVIISAMMEDEAISLLTSGVIVRLLCFKIEDEMDEELVVLEKKPNATSIVWNYFGLEANKR